MSATVYYFSGTGNTYAIASGIAQGLSGQLISMASLKNEKDITSDADSIGIVFPVYYADVPNILREFIPKLKGLSSKYIFAVSNFGGGAGRAMKTVNGLLRENGGRLSAGFGVHMPQNAFYKPWENKEKMYAKMDGATQRVCKKIKLKKKCLTASRRPVDILLYPFAPLFKSMSRNYMLKATGAGKDESDTSLIYRLDCVYNVSDKCSGCGVCSKVCPMGNIVMKEGRPQWMHRCENCLACLNFCPHKAISGIAQKDFYFLNPGYTQKLAQQQSGAAQQ